MKNYDKWCSSYWWEGKEKIISIETISAPIEIVNRVAEGIKSNIEDFSLPIKIERKISDPLRMAESKKKEPIIWREAYRNDFNDRKREINLYGKEAACIITDGAFAERRYIDGKSSVVYATVFERPIWGEASFLEQYIIISSTAAPPDMFFHLSKHESAHVLGIDECNFLIEKNNFRHLYDKEDINKGNCTNKCLMNPNKGGYESDKLCDGCKNIIKKTWEEILKNYKS